MNADRKFLFEYRFGGHEWAITIHADSPAEAKEKIKAVALARYKGEEAMRIYVPAGGWLYRIWERFMGGVTR